MRLLEDQAGVKEEMKGHNYIKLLQLLKMIIIS